MSYTQNDQHVSDTSGRSTNLHLRRGHEKPLASVGHPTRPDTTAVANNNCMDSDVSMNCNTSNSNNVLNQLIMSPLSTSSMRDLRKSYHAQKKYFTKNFQSAIESTPEIHSGWLKARTNFKRWTKVWCQVKPGYLILYTSQEALKKHRLGVVMLSVCQVIKRPTKKDGFCFKLINTFGCSVWAKSSTKALVFAQGSLTLRVSDNSVGGLWLDALHRCHLSSNLEGYKAEIDDNGLTRDSGSHKSGYISDSDNEDHSGVNLNSMNHSNSTSDINSNNSLKNNNLNNNNHYSFVTPNGKSSDAGAGVQTNTFNQGASLGTELRNHQNDINMRTQPLLLSNHPKKSERTQVSIRSNLNTSKMVAKFSKYMWKELQLEDVEYVEDGLEELGSTGMQTEEVHESNKNLLWHIIKQVRPGMDLSKVTLPTFILEPRSFLEKLADYYYHCDILSEAVLINDPVLRLINIVKWYLSGFYKKPKGPKKPYNPILGERFRCFWDHPITKSRTFFIAEQVSHHPPISAFHVANRKDGYTITCALLSRSKYTGNSVSAILDGKAKLHLIARNETYTLTMPYANCRGILLGSLCLELGGKVEIECVETSCKCELDFKLASMWASANSYNALSGKILKGNRITHTLEGHWDKRIDIIDKATDKRTVLWEVTDTIRNSRLKRYTVKPENQGTRESTRLWSKVTAALVESDQVTATAEKTKLEDMQRKEARERLGVHKPQFFTQDYVYKWIDNRPWNERRDIMQFEKDFRVRTLMLENEPLSTAFNPDIDLLLTHSGVKELAGGMDMNPELSKIVRKISLSEFSPDTIKSIESKIAAGNMLFEEAIKQVTEKNRKLEEDIAVLKHARGKRTMALMLTALIVALMSAYYGYFT